MNQCPFKLKDMAEIKKILSSDNYKVRPESEQVPNSLADNVIGQIFSRLIRMRDDKPRDKLKQALNKTLDMLTINKVEETTQQVILSLAPELKSAEQLNYFLLAVPICVIGSFLGYRPHQWPQLIVDAQYFSRSIIIGQEPINDIDDKIAASENLYSQIELQKGFLFTALSQNVSTDLDCDIDAIIANLMGLLFQVSDGTTSLLGLTLIEYNKNNQLEYHQLIARVLDSVPPIKNTKRFIFEQWEISQLIVPLIAETEILPFGYGKHRCPGEHIAKAITLAVIDFIIQNKTDTELFSQYYWKDLPNANYPLFHNNNNKEH